MWQPHYQITNQIAVKLSDIAQLRAKVEAAKLLPIKVATLRRRSVIKIAHTSTSIEGNELREFQVQALVEGKKVHAQERQIREVENYLEALRNIDELAKQKSFDTKDILSLHHIVMNNLLEKEKTGHFRSGPVCIVSISPTAHRQVVYTALPARIVSKSMTELLEWLYQGDFKQGSSKHESSIHPVIQAGLLHYQLATIHPFADGNGRIARLLVLLHLYQSGWGFRNMLVLEEYYNNARSAYYQALDTGRTYTERQGVDLTAWLGYFIEGFWQEALRTYEEILRLQTVGKTIRKTNEESLLGKEELTIVDFLVTMGKITSDDVVDILEIPKRTAQAKLQKLEKLRVIGKQGAGPATYYVLDVKI